MFFGLDRPLDLAGSKREVPSPMHFVEARKHNQNVWIDIEKPFWWDVPVWLASGQLNSIGIANNHMCRSQMYPDEAWGKPRNLKQYPNPRGNGLWTQEIYYHVLDSGLRIPPSAGSAGRVCSQIRSDTTAFMCISTSPSRPIGGLEVFARAMLCYQRSSARRQGERSIARSRVQAPKRKRHSGSFGDPTHIKRPRLAARSDTKRRSRTNDPVRRKDFATTFGRSYDRWVCVVFGLRRDRCRKHISLRIHRALVCRERRHSAAASAGARQFFLDWVNERIDRVKANVADETQRRDVLSWHEKARAYWQKCVKLANAE